MLTWQGGGAAQGRRLLAAMAPTAGGLVDLSQKAINYTVGGSQHVAVNLTLAAAGADLRNATDAVRDHVTSGGIAQRLSASGAALAWVCWVQMSLLLDPDGW